MNDPAQYPFSRAHTLCTAAVQYLCRMRVRQLVVRVLGEVAIDGARQMHVPVLHGRALAAVLVRKAK